MSASISSSISPSSSPTLDFHQFSPDFYFEGTPRSWSGCLAYGHYHGYELASISSTVEAATAINFVQNYNDRHNSSIQDIWTGGYQPPMDDSWVWTDGTDFDETLWAPTQPDNQGRCIFLNNLTQIEDDDCRIKRNCVYKTKSSNQPSSSAPPTTIPSSSLSPSISPRPSISDSPSTAPSHSFSPSTTVTPTNEWNLGSASAIFKVNINPQMEISHFIGSGVKSIRVALLDYSCREALPKSDNTFIIDSSTILTGGVTSSPVAKYTIEFSSLESSNVIEGKSVQFCTKLELLDDNDFSVTFRKQKFSFEVDLSVGFSSISINTEESTIEEFTFGSLEFFGVSACQCQNGFTCSSETVEQNANVGICMTASSTGVKYTNFDLFVHGNGDTGFQYQPVFVGINGSEGQFGTTIEHQDEIIKINFPLVTGLFDDDADQITVIGTGQIKLITDDSSRRNRRTLSYEETQQDEATRAFDVQVTLERPKRFGCLSSLIKKMVSSFY